MDAACGRRPLAQVLRNSLPVHPPPSAMKRDPIQNAISGQRRERSYTPVAGDSCCDNGLFHMDAACGRRPLAQVLRNSLPGHPPLSATKRDTIQNAISSQRREGPSRHRVIGTWCDITIICQTIWRMILLHPLDATH